MMSVMPVAAIIQEPDALASQVLHFRADTERGFEDVRGEIQDRRSDMSRGFDQVRGEIQDLRAGTARLHPDKTMRGVFVTLAPAPDDQQRCQELGIELAR